MTATAQGFDPVHQDFLVAQHRLRQAATQIDLALIHQAPQAEGGSLFRPVEVGLVGGQPAIGASQADGARGSAGTQPQAVPSRSCDHSQS